MEHKQEQEAITMARLLRNEDFQYFLSIFEKKMRDTISFHAPRGTTQKLSGIKEVLDYAPNAVKKLEKK